MALEAALSYEKQTTSTDLWSLHQQSNDFAGHVLVFMLRAVVHKWQQPLAFYICQGATSRCCVCVKTN